MSKPEDIPEGVWDAVGAELSLPGVHVHVNSYSLVRERFSRTIIAATAAEREACAVVVVDYMNELAVANEEARGVLYATLGHTTNEGARRGDLIAVIRDDLSEAIRERGEPL